MDPEARSNIISSHGPLISSAISSVYGKPKGTFSVDDSGPPSPTSGPVINFGQVAPGIYRSSFPMHGNFEHLRSLGLKTILYVSSSCPLTHYPSTITKGDGIRGPLGRRLLLSSFPVAGPSNTVTQRCTSQLLVTLWTVDPLTGCSTLVPQEYPVENVTFMEENGIQHFQIPIPAHKTDSVTIPLQNIANALDVLRDPERLPVLVHCNKGKHRTGCIIACYRMINHWSPAAVITEYRKYSAPKNRPLDEAFIYNFDIPGMLALLKTSSHSGTAAMMLPTPPPSDRDCDVVEDDAWTLHVGI
ncbi:MAG: hypothetical protein Q9181_001620 [Wetmoreana brouardii]